MIGNVVWKYEVLHSRETKATAIFWGLYMNQEAWTQWLALDGMLAPLGNFELLQGLCWILDQLIPLLGASAQCTEK